MATLAALADRHTDLSEDDLERIRGLLAEWSLLADLAMADLVLWLPVWHGGGFVAGAQVRAATAATRVADDLVGTVAMLGARPDLERALAGAHGPVCLAAVTAVPVMREGRPIAVLSVHHDEHASRAGRLEQVYRETAEILLTMVADGSFPPASTETPVAAPPRVGDGLIVCDAAGLVRFASPNAVSACRRLGWGTALLGQPFAQRLGALIHRPGPVDESLLLIAGGRVSGTTEVASANATLTVRSVPLGGQTRTGALLLLRDVTELRRSERALLGKDATIREIHHRVKNNLHAVAALLRLQQRRVGDPAAAAALAEAGRRVATIAVVHETLAVQPGLAVDFDGVLRRLIGLVVGGLDVGGLDAGGLDGEPAITVSGHIGTLDSAVATPLALVVCELLENAVRHGRPTAHPVAVTVGRTERSLRVAVRDYGPGLPPAGERTGQPTLGLLIVESLVSSDLRGSVTIGPAAGAGVVAEVTVPLGGEGDG